MLKSFLPNISPSSSDKNSIIKLVLCACQGLRASPTGLGQFCRESLVPVEACTVEEPSSALWPVPLPRWCWTDCKHLSPKRRRRLRFLRARHELLQLTIASLNWEVLGYPLKPPPRARLGAKFSNEQHSIVERLESLLDHFLRADDFTGDDLGRTQEKFSGLIDHVMELPLRDLRLEDLQEFANSIMHDLDTYSSHFRRQKTSRRVDRAETSDALGTVVMPSGLSTKPVVSDRVKWKSPPSFDATPFLDDLLVRAAFQDPEVLRKDSVSWPVSHPARVHCSRPELLDLATRWDQLGACMLIPAAQKDFSEAVGLFCVPKDRDFDRLIVNPTTINSRMHTVSKSTKELAPGCLLSLLHLDDHEMFRFSADDLSDYYYTFVVSPARATRNAIRMVFDWSEVAHFRCFRPEFQGQSLLICLKTLAMGDSLAVEIGQQAHGNVLKQFCGGLLASETLRYRYPVPRSDFIELLAIDDHVGIQKLSKVDFPSNPPMRDTQIFKDAEFAYKHVGLIQQKSKQRRNQTAGVILGADFDGSLGRVMAPRQRILVLSLITLAVVFKGVCTPQLLSTILGCWVHVLMFRRVLFAVMDTVFQEGQGLPKHQVFKLSRQALCELQLLTTLGPLAQTDLRVKHSENLYSTDASPDGGAVVVTKIGTDATRELWRHTEQKGFYTKLQSPVSSILTELGYEPETVKQLAPEPNRPVHCSSVPAPLAEGYLFDCCEIFRGTGNWTAVHSARALVCHDGFDVDGRRMRISDLASASTFRELVALASRRVVRDWHAGVPCPSFGTLRKPQVRSNAQPFGFNPDDPYTFYHNMLARRTCMILTIALVSGSFISVEQPQNSRLFRLHCYQVLLKLGCVISHFAFCCFGSAFRKASKWLHNKPWLIPLECSCDCPYKGNHFVIEGSFTKDSLEDFKRRCRPSCQVVFGHEPTVGQAVSDFSAAYPLPLVHQMASGLVAAKRGSLGQIPLSKQLESLREVGLEAVSPGILPSTEELFPDRAWFEDPEWIHELSISLPFKEVFRYRFMKSGHINVNESRTYKSWIKYMAKHEPDSRFVGLLDSRVTIGASAKGRSSSFAICRILQGSVAYVLGGGLYPGCLHCNSKDNRADDPTRNRPVRPPERPPALWLTDLLSGKTERFDAVVESGRFQKNPARWLRFLLLLAGDIERNPGPARGKLDLTVGFAPATSLRMSRCLEAFQSWVSETAMVSWAELESEPQALALALRAYGLYLFEAGHPRYMLVYAITAVQDRFPLAKAFTAIAWQIDKKWQVFEPGVCRAVLPALVIRAAVALAVLWQWQSWAGVVLLAFAAMLHPTEMLSLCREDLIFPSDVCFDTPALFVRIRDPKTARFARRQHGRIDDPAIILVAEHLFGSLDPQQRLYPNSMATFRKQWNAVMTRLGVPCTQAERGATPGVLRGSGATYLYSCCEDVNWIAWRGRWSRVRTLEFYLQEVAAYIMVHSLTPIAKARVEYLSQMSWSVLWFSLGLDKK